MAINLPSDGTLTQPKSGKWTSAMWAWMRDITAQASAAGTVTSVTATTPIVSSGGTTPNISHAASGVTAATYGDSTHVAQVTVNATGHVTAASSVAIAATGDVVGPGSATDNAITRFDGTTGKLIQNSGITIADGASGTLSNTNTGDQNLFQTIAVSGQSNIVADSTADTLTVVAGTGITLTTDATTDALTITASGSAGSGTEIDIDRLLGDGATTTFNLADLAEYVIQVGNAGAVVDPTLYALASNRSQVTFTAAPTAGNVLVFQYVVATV